MREFDGGFVKVYRSLLDWEWYDDQNTKSVFLHILLKASWKETKWHGKTICAGEWRTTVAEIADDLKLSPKNVRTALEHLRSTNEVAIKTTPKNTIITVNNWGKYQLIGEQNGKQAANKRQTTGEQAANSFHYIEEGKESKEGKKGKRAAAADAPTLEEVEKYCSDKGYRFKPEVFVNYYAGIGWRWNGQPITDWKRFADKWNAREDDRRFRDQRDPQPGQHSSFNVEDLSGLGFL